MPVVRCAGVVENYWAMINWASVLIALISALTATGGVSGLFHLRETKRAKRLENDRTAASEWKELYERSEAKAEAQAVKIEKLHEKNQALRDRLNAVETVQAVSKVLECRKHGCVERDPPFGSHLK